MTATFMPKPLFEDNASGMHVLQSLWKGETNLFYDKGDYAELRAQNRMPMSAAATSISTIIISAFPHSERRNDLSCAVCTVKRDSSCDRSSAQSMAGCCRANAADDPIIAANDEQKVRDARRQPASACSRVFLCQKPHCRPPRSFMISGASPSR
jgi:hypothetical protein